MEATITILKKTGKSNITFSKSKYEDGEFRSYNFTGTLSELSDYYTSDGKDLSKQIVDAGITTTIIVNNEAMGEAIVERAAQIYAEREAIGNANPAITLTVNAKSLKIPANILISGVTQAHVDSNVELGDSAEHVLNQLNKAKAQPKQPAKTGLVAAKLNRPKVMTGISNLVREYF